jgi:hypothetical protein
MPIISGAGVAQGMAGVSGLGSSGGTQPSNTGGGGSSPNGQSSQAALMLPSSQNKSPQQTGMIPQWGDAINMFSCAQALVDYAGTMISALSAEAQGIVPPSIIPNFPIAGTPPTPITVQPPTLIDVAWTTPNQPAPFSGTLSLGNALPGPLQAQPPVLDFGAAPAAFSGAIPTPPTLDLNFTYPTVNIQLPNPPSLMSLDTVQFKPLDIPTFDVLVPTLTIATPNIIPYVEGAGYASGLLTDLQSSLDLAIQTGAFTTLTTQAQQALFDAGREREYRQQADALLELERMETLGYAFPPGVFIDARVKLQTETANTISGLSRDIMYKQADIQLQNIISARAQAVELEGKLIDYANQVNQRALEAAKYVTDAAVSIYNAQVQAYAARLEGYKTQALVYDTQLKGIQAYVDELNAQIAFEKTKADINTALVEQYKVEVDAALANLEIYKVEAQIIQIQAEVEKIKVDAFGAQIQAYVGTVNAYTAQIEGYKARVETQGVIENVYKTQVDAYAAEVQAGVAEIGATVEAYKANIQAYEAQLEGYKAALQAMVEQARSASEYNQSQVAEYTGQVQASSALNQAVTQQWEAILNEQEKIAEVAVKAAEANGQLYIAAKQLSMDASKVGAQVAAQLGAAALNAIHWSNSSTWNISSSVSLSASNVSSNSDDHIFTQSE